MVGSSICDLLKNDFNPNNFNFADDVNKQISMIKLLEGRSKAEEEKIMAHTKELQRKALRNKTLRTDISAKNEELKEEIRNVTSMTKDLVDRLNYPKAIIRTLLKVSSENLCEGMVSFLLTVLYIYLIINDLLRLKYNKLCEFFIFFYR